MWRVGTLCLAWYASTAWSLVSPGKNAMTRRLAPVGTRSKVDEMDSAEKFNVLSRSSDALLSGTGLPGIHQRGNIVDAEVLGIDKAPEDDLIAGLQQEQKGNERDVFEASGVRAFESVTGAARGASVFVGGDIGKAGTGKYSRTVSNYLGEIDKDMRSLETAVGSSAKLRGSELGFLVGCTAAAGLSPFLLPLNVVEVLAAACAAVAIYSEYVGKRAVSDGKEIAAVTKMAAAESESIVAAAERSVAVVPQCVGIATIAGALAVLAPSLLEGFEAETSTEILLICPLVSVLAAAVAGLAYQETKSLCSKAMSTGTRRFAKADAVGNSWLSASEQTNNTTTMERRRWTSNPDKVIVGSEKQREKFTTFAVGILPAPLLAALFPGALGVKCVIVATTAASQAAYYLACSEYEISQAVDSVALKLRAAGVAETYAAQGARSGSILPYTSAVGALTGAGAAALFEIVHALPFLAHQPVFKAGVGFAFPALASLTAAAATVSKARCEVDASATKAASEAFSETSTITQTPNEKNPLNPLQGVLELFRITLSSIASASQKTWKRLFSSWFGNQPEYKTA